MPSPSKQNGKSTSPESAAADASSPTKAPHPPLLQRVTSSRKFQHQPFDRKMTAKERKKQREERLKAAMDEVEENLKKKEEDLDQMRKKVTDQKKTRDELLTLEQEVLAGMIDDAEAERRQGKLCSFKFTKEKMRHIQSVIKQKDRAPVLKKTPIEDQLKIGEMPDLDADLPMLSVKTTRAEEMRREALQEQRDRARSPSMAKVKQLTRSEELKKQALQRQIVHKMRKQQMANQHRQQSGSFHQEQQASAPVPGTEEAEEMERKRYNLGPARKSVVQITTPEKEKPEDGETGASIRRKSTTEGNDKPPTRKPSMNVLGMFKRSASLSESLEEEKDPAIAEQTFVLNVQRIERLWSQVHDLSRKWNQTSEEQSEYNAKKAGLSVVKAQTVKELKRYKGKIKISQINQPLIRDVLTTIIHESDQTPGNIPLFSAFMRQVDMPYKDIIQEEDFIVGAAVDGCATFMDILLEYEKTFGPIPFDAESLICSCCYNNTDRIPLMMVLMRHLGNDPRLEAAAKAVPEAVQEFFENTMSQEFAMDGENGREPKTRLRCCDEMFESKAFGSLIDLNHEREDDGMTVPMRAAHEGNFGAIEFLFRRLQMINGITFSFNVKSKKDGRTLLMHAVEGGDYHMVDYVMLVDGIDIHAEDHNKMNAVDWAVHVKQKQGIIDRLVNVGVVPTGNFPPEEAFGAKQQSMTT